MKKINWEQMLPTQILLKDSYDKNFHIKDIFNESRNNNQVSIEIFESQRERLFWQVFKFEKLEIEDNFIVVEKKYEEGKTMRLQDDLVWKETKNLNFEEI